VAPPYQRLEPGDPAVAQLDDRLVMQLEFVVPDAELQLALQAHLRHRFDTVVIADPLIPAIAEVAGADGFGLRLVDAGERIAEAGQDDVEQQADDRVGRLDAVGKLAARQLQQDAILERQDRCRSRHAVDDRHLAEQVAAPALRDLDLRAVAFDQDADTPMLDDIGAVGHVALAEDFLALADGNAKR
jgi:hypothetical protein